MGSLLLAFWASWSRLSWTPVGSIIFLFTDNFKCHNFTAAAAKSVINPKSILNYSGVVDLIEHLFLFRGVSLFSTSVQRLKNNNQGYGLQLPANSFIIWKIIYFCTRSGELTARKHNALALLYSHDAQKNHLYGIEDSTHNISWTQLRAWLP